MHIEPKGRKKFVSLSDGGKAEKLKKKYYETLVFSEK